MEVVNLLAGIICFLGLPAGFLVSRMAREELPLIKKWVGLLKKISLVLLIVASAYFYSFPYAAPVAVASLLLFFFEIPTPLTFLILPLGFLFVMLPQLFASLVFMYAFFCGCALYATKKELARSLLLHAPYFVVFVVLFVVTR